MIIHKKLVSKIALYIHKHRKAVLVCAIPLISAVIVVVGMLYSQKTWDDYSHSYGVKFSTARVDLDKAVSKTLSKTTQVDKLNEISKVQTRLSTEAKSYCDINPLVKWQAVIKQYAKNMSDCAHQKDNLTKLLTSLGKITAYLKVDHELSDIISVANTKTSQNNQSDKWNTIEAFWRQASTDTSKLTSTGEFNTIKVLAVSKLSKIADDWKALSTANDSKNRQQFESAHSSLDQSYDALTEVSSASLVALKKLADSYLLNL